MICVKSHYVIVHFDPSGKITGIYLPRDNSGEPMSRESIVKIVDDFTPKRGPRMMGVGLLVVDVDEK